MKHSRIIGVLFLVAGALLVSHSLWGDQLGRRSCAQPAVLRGFEWPTIISLKTEGGGDPCEAPAAAGFAVWMDPTPDGTHGDYLIERAWREAEAAAQRGAMEFRQVLLTPVRHDDEAFAKALYSVGANAKSVFKSKEKYREYVSARFYEEIARRVDIQDHLDGILFEYVDRLNRIAQQIAIESGLDIDELPFVNLTMENYDQTVEAAIGKSVGGVSSSMRRQARSRGAMGVVIFGASVGVSFITPIPFVADLAVGGAVEAVVDNFRDPVGQVAMDSNRAVEQIADFICYGTEQNPGMHGVFLKMARVHILELQNTLEQHWEQEDLDGLAVLWRDHHE